MKIISVYHLIQRLEEFYNHDSFISDKEFESIFNDIFALENELQKEYIK